MKKLPILRNLSQVKKDELIIQRWEENQRLEADLPALKGTVSSNTAPKKNSNNSSNPPSTAQTANKTASSGKTRKPRTQGNNGRRWDPHPTQIVVARAKTGPHGGEPVNSQRLQAVYDKIEIPPIKPIVTPIQPYGGPCCHGDNDYVSRVPAGLESQTPSGNSVQTLATYLRYNHAISYNSLLSLFKEIYHLEISEGGLANLFKRVNDRLEPPVEQILTRLRSSRIVCSDETSARVNGKTQWEWVFQNQEVCLPVLRPSRGQNVIEPVMAGNKPEVWVSDLYRSQANHPASRGQVGLAHQLRDGKYAIEAGDQLFAPQMKKLLLRAVAVPKRRTSLKENTLSQYRCDLKRRLVKCLDLEPTHPDGIRLKKRYVKSQDSLFFF